jgi:hypothetical protein
MIDIAIIVPPYADDFKLQRCLWTLRNEQCPVYFIDGKEGYIGHGRAESLKVGVNPYVSFVDPDDEVIPGIYNIIKKNLSSCPEVLYHNELIVDSTNGTTIHHGWMYDQTTLQVIPDRIKPLLWDDQNQRFWHSRGVFKKSTALKHEKELREIHKFAELRLMRMMSKDGEVMYLNEWGYIYNIHGKNTSISFL